MTKVAFVSCGESPAYLLGIMKKQTPGCSGRWGRFEGVDNYDEADVYIVSDDIHEVPGGKTLDPSRCVFLGTHPEGTAGYRDTSKYERVLARTDAKDHVGKLEWWVNITYDQAKALQPMTKPRQLGCILSNHESIPDHIKRKSWIRRFTSRPGMEFDLHGRIIPDTPGMQSYYRGICGSADARGFTASGGTNCHMWGKEPVYQDHKYMIEIDHGGKSYFSERVLDCLLFWAFPIYWGGNLHSYLPEGSYRYFDIGNSGEDVLEIAESGAYEHGLPAMEEARRILLDELQVWPRAHKLVFGTYS